MAGLALGWLGSHSLKAEVCSSCRRWEHGIVKARSAATRQRAKQVGSSGLSPTSAEGEDTVSDRHLSVPALLGVFVAFGAAVLLIGRLVLAVMGWDQVDYADYGQSAESLAQNILVPDLCCCSSWWARLGGGLSSVRHEECRRCSGSFRPLSPSLLC